MEEDGNISRIKKEKDDSFDKPPSQRKAKNICRAIGKKIRLRLHLLNSK